MDGIAFELLVAPGHRDEGALPDGVIDRVLLGGRRAAAAKTEVDDFRAVVGRIADAQGDRGRRAAAGRRGHEPAAAGAGERELDVPVARADLQRHDPRVVGDPRVQQRVVGVLAHRRADVRAVAVRVEHGRPHVGHEVHRAHETAPGQVGIDRVGHADGLNRRPVPRRDRAGRIRRRDAGIDDRDDQRVFGAGIDVPRLRHVEGLQVPLARTVARCRSASGLCAAGNSVRRRGLRAAR